MNPGSSRPVTPDEIAALKVRNTSDAVFEAFNVLIIRNWDGNAATVSQVDVVAEILGRGQATRDDIFKGHWLDIEVAYREAGWRVVYDKPGWNESYDATFTFTRGNAR